MSPDISHEHRFLLYYGDTIPISNIVQEGRNEEMSNAYNVKCGRGSIGRVCEAIENLIDFSEAAWPAVDEQQGNGIRAIRAVMDKVKGNRIRKIRPWSGQDAGGKLLVSMVVDVSQTYAHQDSVIKPCVQLVLDIKPVVMVDPIISDGGGIVSRGSTLEDWLIDIHSKPGKEYFEDCLFNERPMNVDLERSRRAAICCIKSIRSKDW